MMFSFFKKKADHRLLIISDVMDASYFVLLQAALDKLKEERFADYFHASSSDSAQKILSITKNLNITDVIFLRSTIEDGKNLIHQLRQNDVKTIYLIDDDLLSIHKSPISEVLGHHTSADVIIRRIELINNVDYVWASTAFLQETLIGNFPDLKIMSPFHPCYRGALADPVKDNGELIFGYMGSKGHKHDLQEITPQIQDILEKNPKVHFQTFGTIKMPEILNHFGNRVKSIPPCKDYYAFMEKLSTLGWKVGLAPLQNSSFNYCKTFIKFLEYSSAGIAIVASKSPVYHIINGENGILSEEVEWEKNVIHLLENSNLRNSIVSKARETANLYSAYHQALNLKSRLGDH